MSIPKAAFPALAISLASAALAQPGTIDPSFGGGTQVINTSPWGPQTEPNNGHQTWGSIYWLGVQSSGKVIAVGKTDDIVYGMGAARFNLDGSLDTSFGQGGSVTGFIYNATTGLVYGWMGAIDSTDRVIVIETATASTASRLFRFTANGALDQTFGSGGVVSMLNVGNRTWNFASVAVQPDNKIIVAAFTEPQTGNPRNITWDVTIARFNTNGSLDTTFGNFGHGSTPGYIVDAQPGNQQFIPGCLALQPDGKIVVAAWGTDVNSFVARYLPTGAVDTTFGVSGRRTFSFSGGLDQPRGVAVDSLGHIVMLAHPYSGQTVYMARFTSAGALDTSYGGANSGWATITFPPDASVIYGFRLQPDDKAVIPVNWPDNGSNADGPTTDQAVLRFTATGLLDTTFGPSGTGLSQLGGWIGQVDSCRGLVVDLQGRIIIAGTHSTLETSALADPTRGIELTAFHQ